MARFDLTDFEWELIQPLLPNKPRGVARVDDRRVLNGIFWVLRIGSRSWLARVTFLEADDPERLPALRAFHERYDDPPTDRFDAWSRTATVVRLVLVRELVT